MVDDNSQRVVVGPHPVVRRRRAVQSDGDVSSSDPTSWCGSRDKLGAMNAYKRLESRREVSLGPGRANLFVSRQWRQRCAGPRGVCFNHAADVIEKSTPAAFVTSEFDPEVPLFAHVTSPRPLDVTRFSCSRATERSEGA